MKGLFMNLFACKPARVVLTGFSVLALSLGVAFAEDPATKAPEMPKPTAQHEWLQQFVGEWKSTTKAIMPGQTEPMVSTGTESVKPVGEFWTVTDVKATMMDQPFTGKMTLGYDTEKAKYVGTWVDSMTGQLWQYEGTVDPATNKLTLESEGKCPMTGQHMQFKETLELKDSNHKIFTSQMKDESGKWVTMMTSESVRKK